MCFICKAFFFCVSDCVGGREYRLRQELGVCERKEALQDKPLMGLLTNRKSRQKHKQYLQFNSIREKPMPSYPLYQVIMARNKPQDTRPHGTVYSWQPAHTTWQLAAQFCQPLDTFMCWWLFLTKVLESIRKYFYIVQRLFVFFNRFFKKSLMFTFYMGYCLAVMPWQYAGLGKYFKGKSPSLQITRCCSKKF